MQSHDHRDKVVSVLGHPPAFEPDCVVMLNATDVAKRPTSSDYFSFLLKVILKVGYGGGRERVERCVYLFFLPFVGVPA